MSSNLDAMQIGEANWSCKLSVRSIDLIAE